MTFEEYIKNPMGSMVMTNRQMYHDMYAKKWDEIKVRENGTIIFKLYQNKEDYYIHFKIPSEVVPKFYYDTIIRFYLTKNNTGHIIDKNLNGYEVQFYSNDPNFVYTYTHAFKKNNLLIKDLEDKSSKIALSTTAREKNPKDEIGYVKSIYFAYLEFKALGLTNKSRWEVAAKPYTSNVWNNTVMHAEDKVDARQKAAYAIEKKEKRESNTRQNLNTPKDTNKPKFGFVNKINTKSPNQPNFGKFKKTNFNTIGKVIKNKIGKK